MMIKFGQIIFRDYLHFFKQTGQPPFSDLFNRTIAHNQQASEYHSILLSKMKLYNTTKTDLLTAHRMSFNDIHVKNALTRFTRVLVTESIIETDIENKNVEIIAKSEQRSKHEIDLLILEANRQNVESWLVTKFNAFLLKMDK